jgi:hypothetical protein
LNILVDGSCGQRKNWKSEEGLLDLWGVRELSVWKQVNWSYVTAGGRTAGKIKMP